jgi:hypothetical protein
VLESLRVLDWVDEHFGVAGPRVAGGVSMGRRRRGGGVSGDRYIDQINAMPKYLASQSLTEVTWNVAENLFQRR